MKINTKSQEIQDHRHKTMSEFKRNHPCTLYIFIERNSYLEKDFFMTKDIQHFIMEISSIIYGTCILPISTLKIICYLNYSKGF
jgi:hypothetical protein